MLTIMNTQSITLCDFCQLPFGGDDTLIVISNALRLTLHSWCCRELAKDLESSAGEYLRSKYHLSEKVLQELAKK